MNLALGSYISKGVVLPRAKGVNCFGRGPIDLIGRFCRGRKE